MHAHSSSTHKMVRHILRRITHRTKLPYEIVRQAFIDKDPQVTNLFRNILSKDFPRYTLSNIFYCDNCDKFSLE